MLSIEKSVYRPTYREIDTNEISKYFWNDLNETVMCLCGELINLQLFAYLSSW